MMTCILVYPCTPSQEILQQLTINGVPQAVYPIITLMLPDLLFYSDAMTHVA